MPPNTDFGEPSMVAGGRGVPRKPRTAEAGRIPPPTPPGEREETPPKQAVGGDTAFRFVGAPLPDNQESGRGDSGCYGAPEKSCPFPLRC